jgi:hypothetical protein
MPDPDTRIEGDADSIRSLLQSVSDTCQSCYKSSDRHLSLTLFLSLSEISPLLIDVSVLRLLRYCVNECATDTSLSVQNFAHLGGVRLTFAGPSEADTSDRHSIAFIQLLIGLLLGVIL